MFSVAFCSPLCTTTFAAGTTASSISYRVVILKDDKEFLATGDHIYQLHQDNTHKQSEWLKDEGKSWVSPPEYIDPFVKPEDFPIPSKTAFILAALQEYYK